MVQVFARAFPETRTHLHHQHTRRPVIELHVDFDLCPNRNGCGRIDQHQVVATRLHGQSSTGRDDQTGENLHARQTFHHDRAMHLDLCESWAGYLDQGTALGARILQGQVAGEDSRPGGWFCNPAIDQPQLPLHDARTQRQREQQSRQTPPRRWRSHA